MLHFRGFSVGTDHKRVQRDLRMPARRKEAIPFFWILSFYGKNSKSGQDLGTRARPVESKYKWGSWDTEEALGGKGKSFGKLRGVNLVH